MEDLKISLLQVEKDKFKESIPHLEKKHDMKILLAFVRGSHMYGTANEKSDVDITFVYQQPTNEILKGNYKEQMNIGGNDVVGYEIQRYIQLLSQNNPNIIESLDIPEDCLIYKDESMDVFHNQKDWLSKTVEKTILGYADSQIKKAIGLNKNMNNPQPKERKSVLDFCYWIRKGKTYPFIQDLIFKDLTIDQVIAKAKNWGLTKLDNGKGLYAIYADNSGTTYSGLLKDKNSTQLRFSSIPQENEEIDHIGQIWFNLDGFEVHCKQWKSYWDWVEERNQERFRMNQEAGQNVDLKNMMHLFRLLEMAANISIGRGIQVRSENVEFLREIRQGKHNYDDLMEEAERKFREIKQNFDTLDLKDSVDREATKELLLKFRLNDQRKK